MESSLGKSAASPEPRRRLTANFHFIKACNFRCRYCYATFLDLQGRPHLAHEQLMQVTRLLARAYTKVTFVGGEPTLYPGLPDMLALAKAEGAITNLVTNGSRIDARWLREQFSAIDLLTLSIDSADPATQGSIGRATQRGETVASRQYVELAHAARDLGIGIKVNTVVTTVNADDDMTALIGELGPERWKILQAAPVAGQNDTFINDLTPTIEDFNTYVARHAAGLADTGIGIVREPIDLIRGSYIMVDPEGRFFDSSSGRHHYSRPILEVGLRAAFDEITFDSARFEERGGSADFKDGTAA